MRSPGPWVGIAMVLGLGMGLGGEGFLLGRVWESASHRGLRGILPKRKRYPYVSLNGLKNEGCQRSALKWVRARHKSCIQGMWSSAVNLLRCVFSR